MLRSLAAIFGGYGAMAATTMAFFFIVRAVMPAMFESPAAFPTGPFIYFALGFGLVSAFVGGSVTATIARRAEKLHLLILSGIMALLWFLNYAQTHEVQPLWYHLATIAMGLGGVWIGGLFRISRRAAQEVAPQ